MATFFVLPPRELLEHALSDFLARTLPGLPAPNDLPARLLDELAGGGRETFVLYREDLPEPDGVIACLRDVYGAEPGDTVVEVGPPRAGGPAGVRESVVPGHVSVDVPAR